MLFKILLVMIFFKGRGAVTETRLALKVPNTLAIRYPYPNIKSCTGKGRERERKREREREQF